MHWLGAYSGIKIFCATIPLRDRSGLRNSGWILFYETTMEGCLQKLLCIIQKKMDQNENGGKSHLVKTRKTRPLCPSSGMSPWQVMTVGIFRHTKWSWWLLTMLKKLSRKAQASTPSRRRERGRGGLNRMTKQVKKYDDMEVKTKKLGKNGPAIVKNIYSCHLK